jgi:hypothetical protein
MRKAISARGRDGEKAGELVEGMLIYGRAVSAKAMF